MDIKGGQPRIHPGGTGRPDQPQLRRREGIVLRGGLESRGGLASNIEVISFLILAFSTHEG